MAHGNPSQSIVRNVTSILERLIDFNHHVADVAVTARL